MDLHSGTSNERGGICLLVPFRVVDLAKRTHNPAVASKPAGILESRGTAVAGAGSNERARRGKAGRRNLRLMGITGCIIVCDEQWVGWGENLSYYYPTCPTARRRGRVKGRPRSFENTGEQLRGEPPPGGLPVMDSSGVCVRVPVAALGLGTTNTCGRNQNSPVKRNPPRLAPLYSS